MSAILIPIRFCQNPIRTRLFLVHLGSPFHRISPLLTQFQGSRHTRIAAYSNSSSPSSKSSEKEAALAAAAAVSSSPDAPTIFDKIINKEIPSTVVYEDEKVLAFRDINPQAPTHVLIIPKVKDGLSGISKAEERHCEIMGHLLYAAKLVAKQEGLEDGFRVVINDGPAGCQSVYHIHVHLLGGRQMSWPAG